jgi:hypothetical protein
MTQSAIDLAIAQAQEAAARMASQPQAGVPATATAETGAVANYNTAPAAPLTLDDMTAGSMDVNHWMKVSKFGFNLGDNPTIFSKIAVTVDMSTIQYNYSVRYGNPAKYDKSYDRAKDVRGRPWVETLRMAQQQDPKAAEFRSADIPFVLREDLKAADGKVIAAAGEVMGHSVSMTGWKFYKKFTDALKKEGMNPNTDTIDVNLVHLYQKNDKGEWGVVTYVDAAPSGDGE